MSLPITIGAELAKILTTTLPIDVSVNKDLKKNNSLKLGILGMQQSGKTRFLSHLRNIDFEEKHTAKEKYAQFEYNTKSGKNIIIKEGVDIGGDNIYRYEYKKIIQNSDVIFFFFDITRYLDDIQYRRECNSRFATMLEDITTIIDGKSEIMDKLGLSDKLGVSKISLGRNNWKTILKLKNKKLVIFATHKDKIALDESKIIEELKKVLNNTWYKNIVDYTISINTTDEQELKEVCDKHF